MVEVQSNNVLCFGDEKSVILNSFLNYDVAYCAWRYSFSMVLLLQEIIGVEMCGYFYYNIYFYSMQLNTGCMDT